MLLVKLRESEKPRRFYGEVSNFFGLDFTGFINFVMELIGPAVWVTPFIRRAVQKNGPHSMLRERPPSGWIAGLFDSEVALKI